MKTRKGFVLHKMGDSWVVVGVGESMLHFNGMIRLNETGAFLWRKLSEGCTGEQLVEALCAAYKVEAEEAKPDVDAFLDTLRIHDVVE